MDLSYLFEGGLAMLARRLSGLAVTATLVLVRIYDVLTRRPSLPTPVSGSHPVTIWRRALWGSTGYTTREHYVQYFYRGTLLYPSSAARLWSATCAGERVLHVPVT